MWAADLLVRLGFWIFVLTCRATWSTIRFAWRRPWDFLAICAAIAIVLAAPEYVQ